MMQSLLYCTTTSVSREAPINNRNSLVLLKPLLTPANLFYPMRLANNLVRHQKTRERKHLVPQATVRERHKSPSSLETRTPFTPATTTRNP